MITIPKPVLKRAVEALRFKARTEAGMSQEPNLFKKQDTQEWADAQVIDKALIEAGMLRVEVQPGEEE